MQAATCHVDGPIVPIKTVRIAVFLESDRNRFEADEAGGTNVAKYYELIFRWDVDRYVFDPKDQNFDFCIIF